MEYKHHINNLNFNEECKIDNYNNNKKLEKTEKVDKDINKFNLLNRQQIIMNNYKETTILNKELILNNIYSTDDDIYSQIYKQILNPYQKRLNIIYLLLKSDIKIPLNNMVEIIKFFNWLSPLNNEFNMGSKDWAFKKIKYGNRQKFLLQNSISKEDMGRTFYLNYIDLVKTKLSQSKVPYYYFEFKSKRFNKVKDIIWAFDI
jgi:hypothetical protein